MMFGRLGALNAFLTYFQLMVGSSGHNPIISQGTSIYINISICNHLYL